MTQIARLVVVLCFAAIAAPLPWLDGRRRQLAINLLIGYVVLLLAAMNLTGRDAWPLAIFPMMANDRSAVGAVNTMIAIRVLDSHGTEWNVDPNAWSPLSPQSMRGWFENVFPYATTEERRSVAEFLLAKAEWSRRSRLAGKRFGNERLLGPLAAPDTYDYAPVRAFPSTPYAGIRVYRLQWTAGEESHPRRRLLLEFRR